MAINKFSDTINYSIKNILTDGLNGKFPLKFSLFRESNLIQEGVSVKLGQDRVLASDPKERIIVTTTPNASILIKKKAFSTFKGNNDLQWLDRTEKMLLRATKALFAYKVTQIRAYESLTKIETFFQKNAEINMNLLVELYNNAKYLQVDSNISAENNQLFKRLGRAIDTEIKNYDYEEIKQDILLLLERNAFAEDLQLTTWIVDPNDPENFETGPGTGVIEVGVFNEFSTNNNLNTDPSSANISLQDPYRIMYVTEGDIEIAIEEALVGSIGLLKRLSDPASLPVDTKTVVSAGLESLGLKNTNLNIDYIRDRLRVFYLGKPFINPGDGVHFYIRSGKTVESYSKAMHGFDREYYSIDETILEAERILFTNKRIDLETYKRLRMMSDNSFGMRHVFGGYITQTSENWSGGQWTVKVDCVDNMGWLQWSRFMEQPAIQDPQGILEDPLTPYEIKKDKTYSIDSSGGIELLDENKELIRSGLLSYDSGILNGQVATENNLLQGQYNKSGSLSGAKILQHPQGLIYRWKEGIISATAGLTVVDPLSENLVNQRVFTENYGLQVAQDALNNLDIANILSILIVGQPYNVESFIDQAYAVHNISEKSGDLKSTDPLSAVLSVIRRQNNHFGNFRPYRMITMSSETMLQTANNTILRNKTNENILQLRAKITKIDILIDRLKSNRVKKSSGEINLVNHNDLIIQNLEAEKKTLLDGIQEQISVLKNSGVISSRDLITQNFNLFGRSKTLPLTGNYSADHQITRAMTLVGAQRRIEDVRLNRDKNLFIVSDQYDEQTDLRPFLFSLRDSDYKIFKGNFISTYEKCQEAANFLNLEFFCNTQGHLEFRPPQWNKTPLSTLERLFEIKRQTGKNIVPEFLTEVFSTRSASLRREIHSLNIKIVILCFLLNRVPDRTLMPNLNAQVPVVDRIGNDNVPTALRGVNASLNFFGVSGIFSEYNEVQQAQLRSSNRTIKAGRNYNLNVSLGKDGDILNGDTETLLGEFDPIYLETIELSNDILTVASRPGSAYQIISSEELNNLRETFVKLSGLDPAADLVSKNGKFQDSDFIVDSSSENPETKNVEKATKYLKKLQQTISNRDNLVSILKRNKEKELELEELEEIISSEIIGKYNYLKIFQNEQKRLEDVSIYTDEDLGKRAYQVDGRLEFVLTSIRPIVWSPVEGSPGRAYKYVDDLINRTIDTKKTITSIFTGDASKGSLFDHLIEDDSRNLTGPGSGKRFVIRDEDIIGCSFNENPPDFCRIDIVGDAPIYGSSIQAPFQDTYFWAGATDFDLWRQYGYKHGGYKSVPFANDAETQSKPYAILELQLQRLKINSGSVTVVGNEYYEPGDVVYVEAKQLLYYVRSVDHSYSQGSSFSTNLVLEFGHPPGVYLPSPLDIIGQQYTKDPIQGNILTYRNSQGDDSYRPLQADSTLVFPDNFDFNQENINILLDYRDNSVKFTNIMIELSSLLLGNRVVLIRGFYLNDAPDGTEEEVIAKIDIVKRLLQNPVMLTKERSRVQDDILGAASNIAGTIGLGTNPGNNKGIVPMSLPNGLPVSPIPSDKIAEQIVMINPGGKDHGDVYVSNESMVKTFNPSVISKQFLDGREVTVDSYLSVFPKAGPKQRTWLDIKNLGNNISASVNIVPKTFKVSSVIEIGILDIERALDVAILRETT